MGCGTSRPGAGSGPHGLSDDAPVSLASFSVERIIGQGGFAKVNAVIKRTGFDRGTWYAMKTLSKARIVEKKHVGMVLRERALLARLHSPQLVNMHYAFQDARHLYIIMDACLGGDLHYQLTHAPARCFPEEQARFYVASIVAALEFMHAVGVLHRDVKPENVLLDARGQVKVTDLGISMEMRDGVCVSTSGTRPYMAPEVLMTGHRHSTVSDFYSLGITAYQLLVGTRPYRPESSNMRALVRMAAFVPPDKYTDVRQVRRILVAAQERKAPTPEFVYSRALAHVSAEARDFVQTCLVANPRYRLGAGGAAELREHPWLAGLDWDALRAQTAPPPFVPDTTHANCAVTPEEMLQMVLNEEEADAGPPLPDDAQAAFEGYEYRIFARDAVSGREERVSALAAFYVGGGGDGGGGGGGGDTNADARTVTAAVGGGMVTGLSSVPTVTGGGSEAFSFGGGGGGAHAAAAPHTPGGHSVIVGRRTSSDVGGGAAAQPVTPLSPPVGPAAAAGAGTALLPLAGARAAPAAGAGPAVVVVTSASSREGGDTSAPGSVVAGGSQDGRAGGAGAAGAGEVGGGAGRGVTPSRSARGGGGSRSSGGSGGGGGGGGGGAAVPPGRDLAAEGFGAEAVPGATSS